jgi:hypothetical protein
MEDENGEVIRRATDALTKTMEQVAEAMQQPEVEDPEQPADADDDDATEDEEPTAEEDNRETEASES